MGCANLLCMSQSFQPGDYLVFQLESGYALLRLLGVDNDNNDVVWHLSAYSEFYPDVHLAESAILNGRPLGVSIEHAALTNRAFESTQVARLVNVPLTDAETKPLIRWNALPKRIISNSSIRLMMGFR